MTTYQTKYNQFRAAYAKFAAVREQYRARQCTDAEYLAARAAFDTASLALDTAEWHLLDANQ